MTVRKTHGYSDTWDQFIQKVYGLDPQNIRTTRLGRLIEQLGWDQKIGMIVALSHEWTAGQNTNSGEIRKRQRAAAAAERARLTRNDAALTPYVDAQTRTQLPPTKVQQRDRVVWRQATANARAYFHRLDHSTVTRIERIVRNDLRLSPQQWAAAHPYGPKVPVVDLNRYRTNQIRPSRAPRKKVAYNPAGMTPERALQIAMRVLSGVPHSGVTHGGRARRC